jgi:aldose 1-epimerase
VIAPSGQQHEMVHGDQRAVVVEVGGGVRSYEVAGVDVLDGYSEDEMVTAARGQPLIPWPNRLHGGTYTWDAASHTVPLDEPDKSNALHGLCRYRNWVVDQHRDAASVTMRLRLHPSPPYPFALDLAVHYRLHDDGLHVETAATNVGNTDAPYAHGAHPYITVGGLLDDAVLTIPAQTRLVTDENRIPSHGEPVGGTAYDFRGGRRIGALQIDHAYTDLTRSTDGTAAVVLASPDRARSVLVWVDGSYRYLEIFTADTFPDAERRRRGLGVEPMTAPPNAFVTGEHLIRLAPGQTVSGRWGITAT